MSNDARMDLVYVFVFVLVVVLLVANVTMAANKTALDADHTIETLGEENVYSEVTAVVQNDTVERVNQTIEEQKEQRREERIGNRELSERQREALNRVVSDRFPDRQQQREFVTSAITASFVRDELTRNVRTTYAVLNGEQSTGRIAVNISQQQDKINQSIRESLRDDTEVNQNEIVRLVAREIPDEQNLTENGTVPSEVTSASSGVGLVGTLNLGLPVLALVLLGGMFYFTGRDVRQTGKTGGIALAIGGGLGAGLGLLLGGVASGAAESALDANSAEVAAMSDGVVAVVDSMFSTVVTQGLILAAIGILAVGVVVAEQRGYLDSVLGGTGQQGQYQQGQSQYDRQSQGQYQQGQGQYQQGQSQYVRQSQGQYQQGQGQYEQGQGQYDQQNQGQYQQGQDQYQQSRDQYDQQDQTQYNQQGQGQYEQGQDQYDQQDQTQYEQSEGGEQSPTETEQSRDGSERTDDHSDGTDERER